MASNDTSPKSVCTVAAPSIGRLASTRKVTGQQRAVTAHVRTIWLKDGVSSFWVVRDQPSVEAVDAFLEEAKSRARETLRARLLPLIHTKDDYADRDHYRALGRHRDSSCYSRRRMQLKYG